MLIGGRVAHQLERERAHSIAQDVLERVVEDADVLRSFRVGEADRREPGAPLALVSDDVCHAARDLLAERHPVGDGPEPNGHIGLGLGLGRGVVRGLGRAKTRKGRLGTGGKEHEVLPRL